VNANGNENSNVNGNGNENVNVNANVTNPATKTLVGKWEVMVTSAIAVTSMMMTQRIETAELVLTVTVPMVLQTVYLVLTAAWLPTVMWVLTGTVALALTVNVTDLSLPNVTVIVVGVQTGIGTVALVLNVTVLSALTVTENGVLVTETVLSLVIVTASSVVNGTVLLAVKETASSPNVTEAVVTELVEIPKVEMRGEVVMMKIYEIGIAEGIQNKFL